MTLLTAAFANDPAMCFIFPDASDRAKRLPRLFGLLFDSDGRAGMRLLTPGAEAVTMWRAPGRSHVGRWEMLRHLPGMIHALGSNLSRAVRVSDATAAHMPMGSYWYLHIAGCDPVVQGRGHGGAAVRAGLRRAAGRLPTYLETPNERYLGFYRGLGFEVTSEWSVSGGGPRFWSMLRPPD